MKPTLALSFLVCLLTLFSTPVLAADTKAERFEAADSEGVTATRDDTTVYLKIGADVKGPIAIPRLAAPVSSMHWQGFEEGGITLKPNLDTWDIHWADRPHDALTLVLKFDAKPLLLREVEPIESTGDGSFYLPAHFAKTYGEKVRYEPQTYKNTVGFWVGKKDQAVWKIQLDRPGRFNVAVLQGCGKGHGGSLATMSFASPVKDITPTIDFEVVETGHWQNFRWVQLGEIELRHKGEVEVAVAPKQIKKAALMDIRAIHLIRLPDKK